MRPDARRGFTLIELLVSLILLVIVGGGLYQLLLTVQRVSGKQTEVSNLQGNLRTGVQLIQSELSEVTTNAGGGGSSDIESMSATAFRYRGMRAIGEACAVTLSTIKVRQTTWNGRAPTAATDSLYVYIDVDSTLTTDDVWFPESITGVASSTCPDGITASWTLTLGTNLTTTQVNQIYTPSPVRTWEPMEIGSVTDNGQLWLGIRKVRSENTLIPLVGPLDAGGLDMKYYDAAQAITANVNLVKSIWITLRGATDRRVNTGVGSTTGTVIDSLQVRVELRNSK